MQKVNRVILIVMDSAGIGELPDADLYGDAGSDTIGNIWRQRGGINIPNLINLGLGNIDGLDYITPLEKPAGCYGKLAEASAGKDTTTGHWEIAGIVLKEPFPTYPEGFPEEVIGIFRERTVTGILGNKVASGTNILEELGKEHMETGYPIIYTSADSVFQIAAHESVIPLEKLYEMCSTAREILNGKHAVGRVIARPFTGEPGKFKRTANRKDFSLEPPVGNLLERVAEKGLKVAAVGKIDDIFAGRGISRAVHTKGNMQGVDITLDFIRSDLKGLIFTNLVDFDMLYGHRNDMEGYAKALEEFDVRIPEILDCMKEDDLLMITADHGCDPTTAGTDHTREYIPLLISGKMIKNGINIGIRNTYADIAASICEALELKSLAVGKSFWGDISQ